MYNVERANGSLFNSKSTALKELRDCFKSVQYCNDYLLVEALEFLNKTCIKVHSKSTRKTQGSKKETTATNRGDVPSDVVNHLQFSNPCHL